MTGDRKLALAGAGASLVAAVFLALLGADVLAWKHSMQVTDLQSQSIGLVTVHDNTILPLGLARGMLGIDDDIAFRRAADLYRTSPGVIDELDVEAANKRLRAEAALAHLVKTSDNPKLASLAANLLGVLEFRDASSPDSGTPYERSVTSFQQAVRLDPTNDLAKTNLQLATFAVANAAQRSGQGQGSGGPKRGSSTASPGGF